jgi:DNA polymerase I-like protein with 3'-5' exonuclease and polymerase domains
MKLLAKWLSWQIMLRLFKSYSSEKDPHKWLAAHFYGKPENTVTKTERTTVKRAIFGALDGHDPLRWQRYSNMSAGFAALYGKNAKDMV